MSTRVMADGRPYTRTDVREVRPYHRAEPDEKGWRCSVCGSGIHRATFPGKSPLTFWRHDPGTFWVAS